MRRPISRRRQGGFVLALTLLILAVVLATATAFATRTRFALESAQRNKDYAEALLAFNDAQAEMTVRLAVLPRVVEGIGAGPENRLIPDGRYYRSAEGYAVQLQDSRGLINLNGGMGLWQKRLLNNFGLSDLEAEAMLDVLNDYIDPDNLRRLNGAEADDYSALGLPPPRNDLLVTPMEVRAMPRWRDKQNLWDLGLLDFLTTGAQGSINPNTAPWQVLAAIPGIGPEAAKSLVQLRNQGSVLTFDSLVRAGAVNDNNLNLNVSLVASPTILITHWSASLGWGRRYSFTITPFSEYGPWRVDYVDQVAKPAQFPAESRWTALPALAQLRIAQRMGQALPSPLPGGGGGSGAAAPGAEPSGGSAGGGRGNPAAPGVGPGSAR